jgi:hypothetical protein
MTSPKRFVAVLRGRPEIKITIPIMTSAIKNLKGIRRLLKDPEGWVKHQSKALRDDGKYAYCLIGARNKIDGRGEELAGIIMDERWWSKEHCAGVKNDKYAADRERYVHWNDARGTTHKKISAFLDNRIAYANKVLEYLRSTK